MKLLECYEFYEKKGLLLCNPFTGAALIEHIKPATVYISDWTSKSSEFNKADPGQLDALSKNVEFFLIENHDLSKGSYVRVFYFMTEDFLIIYTEQRAEAKEFKLFMN